MGCYHCSCHCIGADDAALRMKVDIPTEFSVETWTIYEKNDESNLSKHLNSADVFYIGQTQGYEGGEVMDRLPLFTVDGCTAVEVLPMIDVPNMVGDEE